MLEGALQHAQGLKKMQYLQGVGDIQRVVDAKVFDIHRFVDHCHREAREARVGVLHRKVFGRHHKDSVFGRRAVWMRGLELSHQGVQVYARQQTGSFRPNWLRSVTHVDV